ncbi:RES family NAD+ phosphorylase [Photobacterium phosphoreum]|nr:RES family NAD+ phosphorylase [Photobacterium phosphoreum]PSU56084.1 hypothetical protein CTM75_19155 [Photobacterium phosphoreum]
MSLICIKCVKDKHLKKLIENKGSLSRCTICSEDNIKTIDYENDDFFQLVKAVLRYNYSEWEYNTHMGGDDYEDLFYGDENIFFNIERAISVEVYEDFVLNIIGGSAYEDYDRGISIFSGYNDGMQNMPLRSIKSSVDNEILKISSRLKTENYFLLESELLAILKKYKEIAEKQYDADSLFYRARVGTEEQKRCISLGFESENHYTPYSCDKISCPPPQYASAGRINRPGVSFFYCATNIYTAVSEVRPHPGDYVSVGKFSLNHKVKLFDLSDSQLINFYSNDQLLDSYIPFHTLTILINKVIPPSERQHYSITQLIADCIRQLGFDGILFSSTVGDGKNIVIFDANVMKYTSDEQCVLKIEKVQYEYGVVPLIKEDEAYH